MTEYCSNCGFQLTPANMSRARRLPEDWQPSAQDREFVLRVRPDLRGFIKEQAAMFRDYWHAKAGKDAAKLNWSATWRNWIRNARATQQAKPENNGRKPLYKREPRPTIDPDKGAVHVAEILKTVGLGT